MGRCVCGGREAELVDGDHDYSGRCSDSRGDAC